jgi:hypothetical protein
VKKRRNTVKKTTENISLSNIVLGFLALIIIVLIGISISRYIAPALTMQLVHFVTLPAYFFGWVVIYGMVCLLLFNLKGFIANLGLVVVGLYAICHFFVASGLGDYALYLDYAAGDKVGPLPVPSLESAKFLPENVADTRLRATGDNSQLQLAEIDEAVIVTKEGESHTAYAGIYRPNDYETRISGNTEVVYIDGHNGILARKKTKFQILPGGTIGSDPMRAFYASIPWYDGTSHNPDKEIIPIINQKDDSILFAMPITTPKTVMVGIFPISNIPTYSGAVIINPVTGEYSRKSVEEIQKDPLLSRARLFPIALAKEVAHASRFAGVKGPLDIARTLLPSNISSYGNYELAPDPEKSGAWPSLYVSNEGNAYLYFHYLPNDKSRALTREVSIDADNGAAHVYNVNSLASPKWIVDSVLTQRLASENLIQSSFGQFDEPTPLEIGNKRYFVFPITSKQGSQVIAFAVTDTLISDQTGQVQSQFFKNSNDIVEWAKNPVFTAQSLRDVFLGQPAQKVAQSQSANVSQSNLEKKIDDLTTQMKALTDAVNKLNK